MVEESKLIVELFVKYNTAQSKDRTKSMYYTLRLQLNYMDAPLITCLAITAK